MITAHTAHHQRQVTEVIPPKGVDVIAYAPPDSTDISPPPPSSPLSKPLRPRLSDLSASDPLPLLPSLSPITYHHKSDVVRTFRDSTPSNTNPFASSSRPRVSTHESVPRSQPILVIYPARLGLSFPTSPGRPSKPFSRCPSAPPSPLSSRDSFPSLLLAPTPLKTTQPVSAVIARQRTCDLTSRYGFFYSRSCCYDLMDLGMFRCKALTEQNNVLHQTPGQRQLAGCSYSSSRGFAGRHA